MKLSVIIVNYNVKRFLYQCLRSVEAAIEGMDADVWVVDNASHDGSIEFLKNHFPKVHFIQNEENVGFSKGNNHAIRLTQSEYVLLLNPDTIVSTKAIHESVAWMDSHEDAGAVGIAQYNAKGEFAWESRRGVPTPIVSFCKISGLIKVFPKHHVIGRYYMRYLDREESAKIEILSGAYMMLRHSALDKVGLLDEDFFMYGEDVDLSYRLLINGWNNYYLPHPIIHYKGESEHPSTIRYVNVFHQAMIIFYEKHFKHRYFLSGLLIRLAVYFKALLCLLKHGVNWFKRFLPKRNKRRQYYCICAENNRKDIQSIIDGEGAEITFIDSEKPIVNVKKNAFYLFDATICNYDSIISELLNQNQQGTPCYLATYHPEIGILMP